MSGLDFSVHTLRGAVHYISLSPHDFAFNFFGLKNVENLKCIKTVLESGRFDRPVFVILAVVGFDTREKPSRLGRF